MDDNKFDLANDAAAIILNKDMGVELVLPKVGDQETIDIIENQNIFVAMAITSLLDDDAFRKLVSQRMHEMLTKSEVLKAEATDEEAPMCSPNSCPGGCCGTKEEEDEG